MQQSSFVLFNLSYHVSSRYYLVEKAKDAAIVGILVGTLGLGMYSDGRNDWRIM